MNHVAESGHEFVPGNEKKKKGKKEREKEGEKEKEKRGEKKDRRRKLGKGDFIVHREFYITTPELEAIR